MGFTGPSVLDSLSIAEGLVDGLGWDSLGVFEEAGVKDGLDGVRTLGFVSLIGIPLAGLKFEDGGCLGLGVAGECVDLRGESVNGGVEWGFEVPLVGLDAVGFGDCFGDESLDVTVLLNTLIEPFSFGSSDGELKWILGEEGLQARLGIIPATDAGIGQGGVGKVASQEELQGA